MISSPIFVLGSSGFGGSSFVAHCIKEGLETYGFSRSSPPDEQFLPYKWNKNQSKFTFEQVDINKNLDNFFSSCEKLKPRIVVNFSSQSMVGESWKNPEHWMRTNIESTTNLIKGLAQFNFLEKYIHFSTPEVYGSTEGWIKESFNFNPSTPYAVSRAAGDMMAKLWHENFDFPVIFTRAANIYGEGQQLYRIIPKTILFALTGKKIPLHGGGLSSRAFIHMEDVSSAIFKIINKGEVGDTYHISPKECITIKELVKMIGDLLQIKHEDLYEISEDRVGKDQFYLLDSEYIIDKLGWSPSVTLENGIERVLDWIKGDINYFSKINTNYIHRE